MKKLKSVYPEYKSEKKQLTPLEEKIKSLHKESSGDEKTDLEKLNGAVDAFEKILAEVLNTKTNCILITRINVEDGI